MACIEGSNVDDFTNMATLKLTPGEGIDYKVSFRGSQKCYIWFDLESWKLAYASYHSRETVCMLMTDDFRNCAQETTSRKLLEQALNNYNNAASKGYTGEIGDSISSQIDTSEKASNLQWAQTNYTLTDENGQKRTTVDAELIEYVLNGNKITDETYNLPANYEETVTGVVEERNVASAAMFNRLNAIGTARSNRYTSVSNVLEEFGFEKYCVSTDGKATVYKADANGSCGTVSVKGKNEPVAGNNVAYTSLEGVNTEGYTANITSTVKHKIVTPETGYVSSVSAINSREKCNELVCDSDPDNDLKCDIIINENSGTVVRDGVYNGNNGVTAKISYEGKLETDDEVTVYAILVDATTAQIQSETRKIESAEIKPVKGGLEEFNVYCVAKSRKGLIAYNTKTVRLANCNNSTCTITKDSDSTETNMKYSINVNGSGGQVYMATSVDPVNKLLLVKTNGEYKFNLQRSNTDRKITLYGIIDYGNSATCCSTTIEGNTTTTPYNCKEWNTDYKKSYGEIKDYCETHLHEEVHGYKSTEDCIAGCIAPCPTITKCDATARATVEQYCNGLYGIDSIKSQQCVNRCYAQKLCNDDKILYRPINNYNPFPNSYDSEAPYQTGARQVGSNWVGFTNYIKRDEKDSTSVTGPSNMVEYVIDLTPEDIRSIRSDTDAKKKNNKKDPYSETTYSTQLTKEYDGEYISSFIHDDNKNEGGFASIFTDPSQYKK